MKKIKVDLGVRSYTVRIGKGAVRELPGIIKSMKTGSPIVLITDRNVHNKAERSVAHALKKLKNTLIKIIIPPGENSKSINAFQKAVRKISARTRGHIPVIIALGGGVVGDLAGFIAATFRRGVPLVQVPTTLLAQVDSSIGGKTAIDIPEAKNLIGAFYQPRAVLADTKLLESLPTREVRNGLAEIIKYGAIGGGVFFSYIEKHIKDILKIDHTVLEKVIYECALYKAKIVEKDERDSKNIRIVLNFGHTLGHAIESASGYSGRYNHGESIALGMLMACDLAIGLGVFNDPGRERICSMIRQVGLPERMDKVPSGAIVKALSFDKKFSKGINRFILPVMVGRVRVTEDVPGALIRSVIKKYAKQKR